ncbi:nuclear intron maturase 4, mitochondrial [Mercurialis annua]|uniref:nuclear intron maturase 4, mitochondrial n=1 Tax=Mercurialis annua TaxID=3986 RepID=UPI002160286D|nr:nuclear intron maturase 4, mitochondrial [Mercurialis annua]XP_050236375.1 nuclear intron maturase 4, mitochondrial [Mercurialis annua]XP_050236378.1 nuclear intron maturase 4, mitochondrial [Mercurialis annua]XP_050236386.1 nuclear intron maturase 4, mitochondrial [Mercurialis annua]XP_050236395.1 nuclear intron maturase 4, mitochondrial [Mercurialis annua]
MKQKISFIRAQIGCCQRQRWHCCNYRYLCTSPATVNSSTAAPFSGTQIERLHLCTNYSTFSDSNGDKGPGKMTLAKDLAFLVEESSNLAEIKPKTKTRMELKRYLELRVKKRVKEQFSNGKFHDLMMRVVANPETLRDAYDCIRLNANVDIALGDDNVSFECLAEELSGGKFDISANTFSISTKGESKGTLVLPKLNLKVIQEAIRIVLEVVYKPHFSKISHGCRSGRGHHSALKYISKEISNPDWWFTLIVSKKLDACVIDKLISVLEDKIIDPFLYDIIRGMYDAQVLNLEFGGYPKGHGLPQEGVLSPILMNIYLSLFDHEIYRLSMKYEALNSSLNLHGEQFNSNLRNWFRKQLKGNDAKNVPQESSGPVIHSCRFMDELLFAVSGSKDVASHFKSEIMDYLQNSLLLDVSSEKEIAGCAGPQAIRFLGSLIRRRVKDSPALRAVHKLKEKVEVFASQKQEAWDAGTVGIGRKWLAHGLRKVKESEIKHLADSNSLLSQISRFRKAGMETDHWYKFLLKIWMQNINAKAAYSEDFILSKYVVEPALPQELRDSFHEFQKCAKKYVDSETAATLALFPNSSSYSEMVTEIIAPVDVINKRLLRYGLITSKGHSCVNSKLILQDKTHIIDWFSGIVRRWHRWYGECENFADLELIVKNQVWQSCIRTLAAKYRIHESEVEKRLDLDTSSIVLTQETDQENLIDNSNSLAFENDEALMYGISYSGLCLLSLARMVSQSRPCNCFVMGCSAAAPSVYTLHVMERQKFPGWKTGFSPCIHPSLNGRRIGLCHQHLKDFYAGRISLQSIDFSSWK